MGEAMCAGVLLMASLAIVQPPAGSRVTPASAATTGELAQPDTLPVQAPATSGETVPAPTMPAAQPSTPQPSAAQPPAISAGVRVAEPLPPARSRYLVQVMEGVLQSAVRYAAAQMNTKLRAVSPDLLQLSGAARARGFRLDGYGVFFDVEVPAALRQTMGWTARMMQQQNDQTLDQAITQLRRMMTELDGKRRIDAETALKLVELRARPYMPRQYAPYQGNGAASAVKAASAPNPAASDPAAPNPAAVTVGAGDPSATSASTATGVATAGPSTAGPSTSGPSSGPPSGAAAGVATDAATGVASEGAARAAEDLGWMQNPDGAYEMEVRDALISAMLGYGSTLALQPEEYLTVAARDNQSVVVPGDLSETVTVILRIKGRDLTDLMAGRLSEQDARRRIEVREF